MARGKPLSFDRDQVLAKAMELFWQNGYRNTGMSQLLDHMGIQRQSFYNAFGSKEQVFREAVTLYAQSDMRAVVTMLEAPGNPLENLRQVFATWRERVEDNRSCGCLVGNTIAELTHGHPEIRTVLAEAVGRVESAFHDCLLRAQQQGLLAPTKDVRALAKSLVVLSQGTALLSKLGSGKQLVAAVMATIEEMLHP